jgi:LysM repeat protein
MIRCLLLGLLLCLANGCVPADESPVNEEQNPHFQRGRALRGCQDFKGAADEFEKAIENNPQASQAHFYLGCLYEAEPFKDYAAAIYHYQKYLSLTTNAAYTIQASNQVRACKRELANGVFALPSTQRLQSEVERLGAENRDLKAQVEGLKGQITTNAAALNQARETILAASNAIVTLQNRLAEAASAGNARALATGAYAPPIPGITMPAGARPHSYVVLDGDTMTGIAQKFNIKLSDLQAANPRIKPRQLRAGQTLNLP